MRIGSNTLAEVHHPTQLAWHNAKFVYIYTVFVPAAAAYRKNRQRALPLSSRQFCTDIGPVFLASSDRLCKQNLDASETFIPAISS